MVLVPRKVQKHHDRQESAGENEPKGLDSFRDESAWILLGEPGAGKTEAFNMEADATGGTYLRVAEFIYSDLDSDWRSTTLFLDGLDEVRGGDQSILIRVRDRLRRLGYPKFRIACRAADWFGSTDREDIEGASPERRLSILLLEPLSENDVIVILRENHGIEDPEFFIAESIRRGVGNLLDNPQTLDLMANAIRGDQWPTTRQETFQLACEKLVEESNKRHRDKQRTHVISSQALLDGAGQLCAALLLSDKIGIAVDSTHADDRFPYLDDYAPPDSNVAMEAVRTKLFRPEGVERQVPVHRSVAEFLAARWLAGRIDREGLALGRVLNLIQGRDSRTVAGLRGLFGWLALHCQAARARLIDADPLTVVAYGDAAPMSAADKRRILAGLRKETERNIGLLWDVPTTHPFGALAAPELAPDFVSVLESPARDAANQSFSECILSILAEGAAMPALATTIEEVVEDGTWWGSARGIALKAWMRLTRPKEAISMLDAMTNGQISDPDDQLAGSLLSHLYPDHIRPEELMNYLHLPREHSLLGRFFFFWTNYLPTNAPEIHLPVLLDELAKRNDPSLFNVRRSSFGHMASRLLSRTISLFGDNVSDDRLFAWLGIGADKSGWFQRDETERKLIASWLESHPERYKKLLQICYGRCASAELPRHCVVRYTNRLHGATAPDDIGLWYLKQASVEANEELAQSHLSRAIMSLMYEHGHRDLSLEIIEAWGDTHPEKKPWITPLLYCELSEDQVEHINDERILQERRSETRKRRTTEVSECISAVRSGNANTELMHKLASVWMDNRPDTHGETPAERFNDYCENGPELLLAAESGFVYCVTKPDLPEVSEIIQIAMKWQEHPIRLPCLVGMELRWRQEPGTVDSLSDDVLSRMVAFQLTYSGETPKWLTHLVSARPALVAEVLIDYASAMLRSNQRHIDFIYQLERDPAYRDVAVRAVPSLLKTFPVRSKTEHANYLENLLRAALRYRVDELPALLEKKISSKSMDATQKTYWLTTGMLLSPDQYEEPLLEYIGKSWTRANALAGFLGKDVGRLSDEYLLSAKTLGKLIELLTPHAELHWPRGGGRVSESMNRGERVRSLVTRLAGLATEDAASEIDRLLTIPNLKSLKQTLENARNQLQLKRRENEFRFLPLAGITQVLANQAPASVPDLAALALDHLDDIALQIRQENDNGFSAFWNVKNNKPVGQRDENQCREELLRRLRPRMMSHKVDCQPEEPYFNNRRADIRLSYCDTLDLPIEIKRDSNDGLWTAIRAQLIGKYSVAPKAKGHGIYLVLWFGGKDMPRPRDGGKKPTTPGELRERLEAQLTPEERTRIFVRLLDVSWPT